VRIFTEPKVILVARPALVQEGITEALAEYGSGPSGWNRGDDTSDGDGLSEFMGRICYGSFSNRQGRIGGKAYFENVLAGGHGSVTEHAVFSFIVARASRNFTHQMVRHRAGMSPSQESQHFIRYTWDDDEAGAQEAGLCLTGVPEHMHETWVEMAEASINAYAASWQAMKLDGLKKKEACERSRGLLLSALESRIGLTMNCRALRHFCELRGTKDNALEIRLVAAQVAQIMRREAPAIFQDLEVSPGADDQPIVTSRWRKV
jgi:thymidylate synthase (FAD)